MVVALVAWGAFVLLEPHGLGWLVIPIAVVATLGVAGVRWWTLRRGGLGASREAAWAEATIDDAQRPRAIAEVRGARGKLDPSNDEQRGRYARLTVLLAQLLDADGDNAQAQQVLEGIDLDTLGPIDAAVVRHGRAAMKLRAEDWQGALAALGKGNRTGTRELDLRLDLLEASARLELGETDRAMQIATRVRRAAGADEELMVEARVVRAAALDKSGQRDEAVKVIQSLGPDLITMLGLLGQRRVRELAAAARGRGAGA